MILLTCVDINFVEECTTEQTLCATISPPPRESEVSYARQVPNVHHGSTSNGCIASQPLDVVQAHK